VRYEPAVRVARTRPGLTPRRDGVSHRAGAGGTAYAVPCQVVRRLLPARWTVKR